MSYRFNRDFATIQDGVRQLALELIDDAAARATGNHGNVFETVHSLRTSCKKLRGLIRLVRPVFDDYSDENAALRDAGRELAFLRDCSVLIETYDSLLGTYKDQIDRPKFAPVRRRLTAWQKDIAARDDIDESFEAFRRAMGKARKRAGRWRIAGDGFDAIEPGIRKSYKGARRAMDEAAETPSAATVHEWRKRVKDHWYHARLLCPMWPDLMKAHCRVADEIGDRLGKHHDLEMFRQRIAEGALGETADIEVLAGLVRRRQKALQEEAFAMGARLLAEPAGGLARRWRSYWDAWHADRPRNAALAA